MTENESIIDIYAARRPYNCYMALSFELLEKLAALLRNEILEGLVDSDRDGRVILHLLLHESKIKEVEKVVSTLEHKPCVIYK